MHRHAVDLGEEMRELVHPRLGGAPVEAGPPVLGQLLDVAQRSAAAPADAGHLIGPAGGREPLLQVIELRLRDIDLELTHRAPLSLVRSRWRPAGAPCAASLARLVSRRPAASATSDPRPARPPGGTRRWPPGLMWRPRAPPGPS